MNINSDEWKESVVSLCKSIHIYLTLSQSDQLSLHVSELINLNKKANLTAITEPSEVTEKHIIDSLIPAKFIPANASVIDLGTGGGFPGIPLKILMPSVTVSLVDSSRKKVNFLKYVIRMLNLQHISAHQFRVGQLSDHPDFAGHFDVVISRAFAALDRFLVLAAPLIKPDGMVIAMKGKEVEKEIDELKSADMGGSVYLIKDKEMHLQLEKYQLPVSGDERSLVIARNSQIN